MPARKQAIIEAIDTAPLNRGLKGIDWVSSPSNIPVVFGNGDIALFDYEGDDVFQIHVLFKGRGRTAIEHARSAIKTMFTDHAGCGLIFGLVPEFRRDVKMLARWSGMRSAGSRNTPDGPCELFILSKFMWKVAQQ